MITQEDIDAFKIIDVTPIDYSYWVEDKIVTSGETRLIENTLGLVGEAGEVAEKIKKYLRDNTKVSQKEIIKELGDVVFYATALSNYFYSNLSEVMQTNMDKLNDRARRDVIKGSGDNR
ncbi:nucleotide pyrophosphohydrolase domain protein [Roseobacter phage CRP-4]|jgi:NTP pyrophosphatase (non-canonical NTP hydrolase)|uniref:Nucleotide pyrophosphohydrolase domain protein n=1 Tax=Roseobacter phage CRP-4 TaxID=2559283 RepID=A0A646QW51_9CAUD|nr:nucleotide pyrophosphohydrolase domain protein [Roseobacter phage CRP-4]